MGLLDRLRGRGSKSSPESSAIAMVMLAPGGRLALEKTAHLYGRIRGDSPALMPDLPGSPGESGAVLQFAGGRAVLLMVDMPIPAPDLRGPVLLAWHWPEARSVIDQHGAHIICHVSSTELTPLELRTMHTRLVAALTGAHDGVGVYIGNATLVRSAPAYFRETKLLAEGRLPLLNWISFCPVGMPSKKATAYTYGLAWFGLREIEVRESSLTLNEVFARMADVAMYTLKRGRDLGHGETFGSSAAERIRVTHCASATLPDMRVVRLEL